MQIVIKESLNSGKHLGCFPPGCVVNVKDCVYDCEGFEPRSHFKSRLSLIDNNDSNVFVRKWSRFKNNLSQNLLH